MRNLLNWIFCMLIVLCVMYYDTYDKSKREADLKPVMIDTTVAKVISGSSGRVPKIKIEYVVGDQLYKANIQSFRNQFKKGDFLGIIYNEKDPDICEMLCHNNSQDSIHSLISVDTLITFDPETFIESMYINFNYVFDSTISKVDTFSKDGFMFFRNYGVKGNLLSERIFCECHKVTSI